MHGYAYIVEVIYYNILTVHIYLVGATQFPIPMLFLPRSTVSQGNPEADEIAEFESRNRKLAKTSEMVVHYTDGSGRSRIKGGSGLRASQSYPRLLLGGF